MQLNYYFSLTERKSTMQARKYHTVSFKTQFRNDYEGITSILCFHVSGDFSNWRRQGTFKSSMLMRVLAKSWGMSNESLIVTASESTGVGFHFGRQTSTFFGTLILLVLVARWMKRTQPGDFVRIGRMSDRISFEGSISEPLNSLVR